MDGGLGWECGIGDGGMEWGRVDGEVRNSMGWDRGKHGVGTWGWGKIGECWEDRWVGWRLVAGGDQVSPIRSPPCTK